MTSDYLLPAVQLGNATRRHLGAPFLTVAPSSGGGLTLTPGGQVGGSTVAPDTASMNPLLRDGIIRAGAERIFLIWDPVDLKWYSQVEVLVGAQGAFTTTSTTYVQSATPSQGIRAYRAFDTVGLQPQLRLVVNCAITGGATASIAADVASANAGANWSSFIVQTPVTTTSATGVVLDTGWVTLSGVTLADFLMGTIVAKTSSGAQTVTIGAGATVHLRWISK